MAIHIYALIASLYMYISVYASTNLVLFVFGELNTLDGTMGSVHQTIHTQNIFIFFW